MQRVLQTYSTQPQSIFIDSSASRDQVNTSLTLVLIATKDGAVPIGVSLHDSQTEASYNTVFSQLRELWAAISPIQLVSIMTDDAAAMKNALASVLPGTRQLLCLIHAGTVALAVGPKSSCNQGGEKKNVTNDFKRVMYSTSMVEADSNMASIVCNTDDEA